MKIERQAEWNKININHRELICDVETFFHVLKIPILEAFVNSFQFEVKRELGVEFSIQFFKKY